LSLVAPPAVAADAEAAVVVAAQQPLPEHRLLLLPAAQQHLQPAPVADAVSSLYSHS
jgi:hypothetical protein